MNKATTLMSTLGFYAKRLRSETITKFAIGSAASLALVLQLVGGVMPFVDQTTVSANQSSYIVSQGVKSKEDMLAIYDRNVDAAGHKDLQQIYTHFGISRADIANAKMGSYTRSDFNGKLNSVGRHDYKNVGRSAVKVTNSTTTVYTGPFNDGGNTSANAMTEKALIGKRSIDGQWFAIALSCGNPVYVVPPPPVPQPSYKCDSLAVDKISRTSFKFSAKYTVKDATFKSVTYVVTDSSGKEISRSTSPNYTQTTPGSYSVQAIVSVTVDGKTKTATGASCKKAFVVEKEKVPGIEINKTVDGVEQKTVAVNEEFVYNLSVKNTGQTDLANVAVSDDAPTGVAFVKADDGTTTDTTWKATIATLKAGETKKFNITAKVTAEQEGDIVNTACVDAPTIPGTPDDCDTAIVEVPPTPLIPVTPVEVPPAEVPPAEEIPAELPKTGFVQTLSATLGLGSIIGAAAYYMASRRNLLSALLDR